MKRYLKFIGAGLILLLPACGGTALPPEQPSAEVAVTAPASTETNAPLPQAESPTHTPEPVQLAATNTAVPPTQAPAVVAKEEPTIAPTDTPIPEPTATFTPEPDWLTVTGRTEQNQMFLGNPNAPATLIDYS